MLGELFPATSMDAEGDGIRELDRLVMELSSNLIDDYPTADPRWAESSRNGNFMIFFYLFLLILLY